MQASVTGQDNALALGISQHPAETESDQHHQMTEEENTSFGLALQETDLGPWALVQETVTGQNNAQETEFPTPSSQGPSTTEQLGDQVTQMPMSEGAAGKGTGEYEVLSNADQTNTKQERRSRKIELG